MKKTLFSLVFVLCLGLGSQAKAATGHASKVNLGFLGGLGTSLGDYAGAFLANVSFQVDASSQMRLGFETGIFFGSGTGLPIFLNATFPLSTNSKVNPYVTATIGPSIGIGDGGVFDPGPLGDSVRMCFLIRPGMRFPVADALDLTTELIMGGFTGIFYIGPNVGAVVNF